MNKSKKIYEILDFWFNECDSKHWFKKDTEFDKNIAVKFQQSVMEALKGSFDHWAVSKDGILALILLLDQFTRNIFRNNPKAFSGDRAALNLSIQCVENSFLKGSRKNYCQFMLMPMMHSEDISTQNSSLPLFKKFTNKRTYEFAIRHRDIIEKFGRFPHRNAILCRPSTKEELNFLTKPGSNF